MTNAVAATLAEASLDSIIEEFVATISLEEIYNEFSLQHELGIYLRQKLPHYRTQFERNVSYFFGPKNSFEKKEIDIVVHSQSPSVLKYAIELKFPRNGRYPESMFDFCKDVRFIEQLKENGFSSAAAVMLVDDKAFSKGKAMDGIYRFFRSDVRLNGEVRKPTGNQPQRVVIRGTYPIEWRDLKNGLRYAIVVAQ